MAASLKFLRSMKYKPVDEAVTVSVPDYTMPLLTCYLIFGSTSFPGNESLSFGTENYCSVDKKLSRRN